MEQNTASLRRVRATFMLIYLLYMSARALFNPYITLFLHEKGFDTAIIGSITAANSLVIIFAQPFWGIVSDRLRSVKWTLIICMVLQAATALVMRNVAAVMTTMLTYCIFGFFSSPEGPLLDTWSLTLLKRAGDAQGVGQLKLLGCLGYSLCSVLSALAVAQSTTADMLPLYAVILTGTAGLLILVREPGGSQSRRTLREMQIGTIFRDRPFLLLLAYMFLMQIPHRAAYTFFATYITDLGGGKSLVGFTSAMMFLSEGLVMFFSRKLLKRFHPRTIILGSAAFFALWQILYAIAPFPGWIVGIAALDGPSYGLFCIGVLYYLDKLAPARLRASYQTIAYAVYFGLAGIAGNALGGLLIGAVGYRPMYWAGAALTVLSSVGYGLLGKSTWKEEVST